VDALDAIRRHARLVRERLPATTLPYWLAASRDDDMGGFLLPDDVVRGLVRRVGRTLVHARRAPPTDHKQLVTQARLVWVFAHAHRQGHGTGDEYLTAARRGHRFLVDHFLDREHGGYRWLTDRSGAPLDDTKYLYGQAFVIYAFVELARASGEPDPLDDALATFRTVEDRLHDREHGGWCEQATGDWRALPAQQVRAEMSFVGRKSADGVLHWMEATTELYCDTLDAGVHRSLTEALRMLRAHLFVADPDRMQERCRADWTVDADTDLRMSYGHNVEFAWMMLRAQDALGVPRDWDRFHAYVEHTLRRGFDHRRGGAYAWGRGAGPAEHRDKVWWVQCELIGALTVALAESDDERYAVALAQTLSFVERHMTDPRDGVLFETVREDGRTRRPRKSGDWKAGYHEVRAATTLVEAFAP
jgi:mannobiose 2-epimerase